MRRQAEDSEVTQRVAMAGSCRHPRGWQVSGRSDVNRLQEPLWELEPWQGCSTRAGTTEEGGPAEGATATRDIV